MKKRWLKSLFIGTLALTLTACGSNAESTEGSSTSPEKSGGSVGSMPDRPFVYVAQQVVGTVDPAKALDETELISVINMYDPLYYPERTDGSMSPAPHLATGYEVSEDGLTYTLTLRDDVTFHSGNLMTADDVVYSIERMLAIGEGNSWLWQGLFAENGVTKVDDTTVTFTLNEPYAPFVSTLTQLFIVDSTLLKENEVDGDYGQAYLADNEAGSGPYTLNKWNRESEISFTAFTDYWQGWEDGKIDEAQMKFVNEEATVKTLLVSGQADMVHQYMNITAFDEFKEVDKLTVQEDPSAMIQEMPMNTQKAPTDDINVRKAIAAAFDYTIANEQILVGGTQAEGPVPLSVEGHSDKVTVFNRDLEKAKAYLAQSKYADQDLTVEFMYVGDDSQSRQYSQLLTSNLAEIGITVELTPVTWPQITEAVSNKETTANLTMISDTLKYPHVDSHTFGKYHPSTHGNYRSASWLDNPSVTSKLEEARGETNVEEQLALYQEAQDLITELAPAIYITNTTHRIAYADYVENYEFVPLMGYDIAFYYLKVN